MMDELARLRALSARIGGDPSLIQGAGGNTSVKDGGTMWIKASGTLLAQALDRDIFVPVDVGALTDALARDVAIADDTARFVRSGGATLRPSIETSLHAIFPQRVVVHVHCVETIAHAIRADARAVIAPKLAGLDWAFVAYHRPGATLARVVQAARRPETDVVVLGNHGLIVAADTVADAGALLAEVVSRLALDPGRDRAPDLAALAARAEGSDFVPAGDAAAHRLALELATLEQAAGGSLYPDHVIFLGIGTTVLEPDETAAAAAARAERSSGVSPVLLAVPGAGTLLRHDASAGAEVMARCLSDVLRRVPRGARLSYLTREQNLELLEWDAEKYRKALNA
jgi:rhamnose utilization protein RhaD (predicted bifunctional aldolase and dehydrogenase)